ncbi:GNAT family N-acetyltransferase [Sporosarcina newyorkensis]|uniref:Predicted acetyltransferase, GNAT superfamily n=1 Tax=Sporosarcina newyorkensis TaxID=759851 RepID=A0A1T4YXL6_9BACL|nr:GNAT family N-acetyltransferase [Sporosarcina newyorkensis]SKB06532.1 Predicted acetyltransferase, GNAT superfamily [Sporosarcina newyorkensis]
MKNPTLTIRTIDSLEDLQKVHALESIVWSVEDTVPTSHTIATVKNGGLILGAFDEDRLIGFQYSFPGFDGKSIYLYSHSLGIHPDYRRLGIGEQLKVAQKKVALEKGYDRIVWTYDPLETVNANLNLHKLRAVVVDYTENAYGEMEDGMNNGIPTDRFTVEWNIREQPTDSAPIDLDKVHSLVETSVDNGFLHAEHMNWQTDHQKLIVPVPANFQELKQHDLTAAIIWREKTREIFKGCLSNGWIVTDLLKHPENNEGYVYILEKRGNYDGD